MVQTVHPRYEHGNVNTAAGPAGLELACLNQAGAPPALAGHTIVVAGSGGAAAPQPLVVGTGRILAHAMALVQGLTRRRGRRCEDSGSLPKCVGVDGHRADDGRDLSTSRA